MQDGTVAMDRVEPTTCRICLKPWDPPDGAACASCGKAICSSCLPRVFRCPRCAMVRCPSCEAKAPHGCDAPPRARASRSSTQTQSETGIETIGGIRILPLSRDDEFEGNDFDEVQKAYFLGVLKDRNGAYRYRRHRMSWDGERILVLFQMKGRIIGSAELESVVPYEQPLGGIYNGEYRFDPSTIRMVEPITLEELRAAVPEVAKFSQERQKLPLTRLAALRDLFDNRSKVE